MKVNHSPLSSANVKTVGLYFTLTTSYSSEHRYTYLYCNMSYVHQIKNYIFLVFSRFNLSLQFLSSVEKATCKQLMEKLNSSFQNRQQDLAEEGITEWTVLELKSKYKV